MELKKCSDCQSLYDITHYRCQKRNSKKKGNHIYVSAKCKTCEKQKNRESHNKASIKYCNNNKEYYVNYRQSNKETLRDYRELYKDRANLIRRERRQTDPEYRIMCNLRCRVRKMLVSKSMKTIDLLGCTIQEFKKWIEWQFDSEMNWNNYGIYWNIDHVVPCASFLLEDINEQMLCFNWKNCRPLNKYENEKKNDKIIPSEITSHEQRLNEYLFTN
jgi:hypothetical protein